MNKTQIEWTDYTWNPVTGCHKVSQGCKNCYAETLTVRFGKQWGMKSFRDVQIHPERVNEPVEMGEKIKEKKVFACDMSDLFHESVPFEFIVSVFQTMALCPDTIFQVLTKRVGIALEFFNWVQRNGKFPANDWFFPEDKISPRINNVWFGVSCEDQSTADERIPLLLQIPAAVRFLSCEPLLGKIDISKYLKHPTYYSLRDGIHWVIAGGESGHGARPMHPDWVRSLRDQCESVNVPFFFKQWGHYVPHSEVIDGQISGETKYITTRDGYAFFKLGKTKSGNLLDGKRYLEFPKRQTK